MRLSIDSSEMHEDYEIHGNYDLVIACCGYERRSSALLDDIKIHSNNKYAIEYRDHKVLSYAENKSRFANQSFQFCECSDDDFANQILVLLTTIEPKTVLVDISCFTRLRLALLVEQLATSRIDRIVVYYSMSVFGPPQTEEPPTQFLGPVTPYLSGWNGASKPAAVISGLGYEQRRAMGIIELIDPLATWLFFPKSPISAYDCEVEKSNKLLLDLTEDSHVVRYPIDDPNRIYVLLASLVGSVSKDHQCIVLCLGPKVFAFIAMLCGCVYRDLAIWRASSGTHALPVDRWPSGKNTKFTIKFIYDL